MQKNISTCNEDNKDKKNNYLDMYSFGQMRQHNFLDANSSRAVTRISGKRKVVCIYQIMFRDKLSMNKKIKGRNNDISVNKLTKEKYSNIAIGYNVAL